MVQQCCIVRKSQLVPALFEIRQAPYKLQRVPTRSTEEEKVILVHTGLLGQLHGEGKVRAAISDIWVTLVPPSLPLPVCLGHQMKEAFKKTLSKDVNTKKNVKLPFWRIICKICVSKSKINSLFGVYSKYIQIQSCSHSTSRRKTPHN